MKNSVTFTAPEVLIPFKCDVHGWMNAYVGVVDHPVLRGHAATPASSSCGRSAGHLHDRSGAREARPQTQTVTLGEKDAKDDHLHVQDA